MRFVNSFSVLFASFCFFGELDSGVDFCVWFEEGGSTFSLAAHNIIFCCGVFLRVILCWIVEELGIMAGCPIASPVEKL
jgi:hypothetical protein